MGIVLQSTGMYRHIAVREAIAHWARFYPRPRDVDEVVDLAGLREKADAYARTLSGGQLRRLDFALALVGDPELIFLDEPTTGFDPAARRAAWDVDPLAAGPRQDGPADHALPRRGAGAVRPRRDRQGGPVRRRGRRRPRSAPASDALPRRRWRDEDGALQTRETDDPTALLHQLTSAALARGDRLRDLSVTRPTLEDVYLELTAEAVARTRTAPRPRRRPPVAEAAALTWRQYRLERRMFWRNPSAAFFNFFLPLLFLALFGAIFGGNQKNLDVIVPGIAGMAIMSTTFSALAMNITFLREQGVLKRMRGTPLPTGAYLGGHRRQRGDERGDPDRARRPRGRLFFSIGWPKDWLELVVFVVTGVVCLASLGVALVARDPELRRRARRT